MAQGIRMGISTADAYLIWKMINRLQAGAPFAVQRGEIRHAEDLAERLWTYIMGCSPHAKAIEKDQAWTQLKLAETEGMG